MRRVLITGATGNVGSAVIRELNKSKQEYKIIAGVRNQNSLKRVNLNFSIRAKYFDFTNFSSYDSALNNIDSLFLLRPPQITDVHKYFAPLIKTAEAKGIKQIIFLSVQGVEKSRLIPHNKIEKLILRSNLNFIFVRPGYFMQNLTTMFLDQIQQFRKLVIPAGKAKFNWIDVKDIGRAVAKLFADFKNYKNQKIELTGIEQKSFQEVTKLINVILDINLKYISPDPINYYVGKKHQGMDQGEIIVRIMLHLLQRFQSTSPLTDQYEKITGKRPNSLVQFIQRERDKFIS